MIEVSNRIKKAFQSDSIQKKYYIYFPNIDVTMSGFELVTNHDIVDESIKLTENLNTEDQLHYGRCEGNMVEFALEYTPYSLVGQIIDIYLILVDYIDEPFTVGRYIITNEKIENNRLTKSITAYDILSVLNDMDVSYWCYNLTFPMTVKQLRNSLFEYVGQTQAAKELINDSTLILTNPWQGEMDISFNKVMVPICEWNAVFGGINRTGAFDYYTLTPTTNEETYPSKGTFPSQNTFPQSIRGKNYYVEPGLIKDDITWENYICKPIDIIHVRNKENQPIYEYTIPNGSGEMNIYVIEDNYIVDNISAESLAEGVRKFAQAVYKIYYIPVTANVKMDLSYEVGDAITLTSTNGTRLPTYILKRVASGGIVAFDEIEATGKEEFEFELSDSASESGYYDDLYEQVEELGDRVSEMETEGSLQIVSVTHLPESPKKNVLYLVQGNVWVN